MPEKVTYSINVQVASGPKWSESKVLEIEAYDKTTVTIAAGATDAEVSVQPGGAGLAQFLLISASTYDDALTYKVNSSGGDVISLNGPLVLIGPGAIGLLDSALSSIFVSNGLTEDVTVSVLVGRDATP